MADVGEWTGGVEVDREAAVPIGLGLRVARRLTISVLPPHRPHDLQLVAEWMPDRAEYGITALNVVQRGETRDGLGRRPVRTSPTPITGDTLRSLPVRTVLAEVLASATDWIGFDTPGQEDELLQPGAGEYEDGLERVVRATGRGPSDESLFWVARVYRVAEIRGHAPSKAVAAVFEVPARTATYWVMLARERGLLDQWSAGNA